ncbi:hypothetical protein AQUCO_03700123v1 [Aquilegia coerulea]|uniref:Polymerase nucleotidyl transferase domain-containing protein n=1 Tax=Aquilegia coerulea TaxID=218851 RepID=A0A2G5CTK1_AQUCA|nr:hypothetical protein AQUCO_03700123v1 [Aquilegia coerulea]
MGDHEGWVQPSGLIPNGLLPNEAASVTRVIDPARWSMVEGRTSELISCIQPNKPSEERRNAVANYVRQLIMKCFPCQVFTFGSVPLKTYLPDGDIDLTAFCKDPNLKDTWATEVRDMLENEEKCDTAEFRVKEVQYIQAEVKIIKCLVENIVVDISFDQLGGLCTLCFLDEVDHLISQNHLFKRSIILIKAWCYYESRILGAHHGLISTYALETLVLYIFHVFNNSFAGPLEVLYRFLEFFSNFDWDNFCVSLWGPVPITSLPDMTAESPRKDNGELLLKKSFLDSCSSVYSVIPGGQENQGQPFVSKHFNVIDPLRTNNNLGRSVSKGNFFRIRSAFAFGAKKLARLLESPQESILVEVDQFFTNTWERHGSGRRPDAPTSPLCLLRPLNPGYESENSKNSSINNNNNEKCTNQESAEGARTSSGLSFRHGYLSPETISRSTDMLAVSRTQGQRKNDDLTNSRVPDQVARSNSSIESTHIDKELKSSRADYLVSEIQGRHQFARTRSSPELTDTFNEVQLRGRHNRVLDGKSQVASRTDHSRRKNLGSEVSGTLDARSPVDEPSIMKQNTFHEDLNAVSNVNIPSRNYHGEAGSGFIGEEHAAVPDSREMHQEEQDLVNMMASSRLHGLGGQIQMPMNFIPSHLPLPTSPSVLNSMGYQKNLVGMVPTNIPMVGPPWGSRIQFSQGLVPSALSHYVPVRFGSDTEEMVELGNQNSDLAESNQGVDCGFWHDDQEGDISRRVDADNGGLQMSHLDDKKQSTLNGFRSVPSSRVTNPRDSFVRGQHRFTKESRGLIREERNDSFRFQNNKGDELYVEDRSPSFRVSSASQASSSRSKTSSDSSLDASSVKTSKSIRDRRGRKAPSAVTSTVSGKGKNGGQCDIASADNGSSQADDDSRDWIPLSTVDVEMEERIRGRSPQFGSHRMPNYEPAEMSGSDSVIPIAPVLVGSGSQQRATDNTGVVPYAFYLTGPPVPFLTMLPVYNFPTESKNSDTSTSNIDREEVFDNSRVNLLDQNSESAESLDQSEIISGSKLTAHAAPVEPSQHPSVEHKSDILHSDFTSHWQNLQYGRFCQNPRHPGPLIYPSPVMVPPMYLQGHFPWEGPGRPVSPNSNIFNQLMSYGPQLVPVAPLQPGSNMPASVYQHYGDESPRYRGGTGTYLPNPKVPMRERQSSNTRNHRGNYNYDRNDRYSDREGNWNNNSRPRASGRSYGRNQDRIASSDSQAERSWESHS